MIFRLCSLKNISLSRERVGTGTEVVGNTSHHLCPIPIWSFFKKNKNFKKLKTSKLKRSGNNLLPLRVSRLPLAGPRSAPLRSAPLPAGGPGSFPSLPFFYNMLPALELQPADSNTVNSLIVKLSVL